LVETQTRDLEHDEEAEDYDKLEYDEDMQHVKNSAADVEKLKGCKDHRAGLDHRLLGVPQSSEFASTTTYCGLHIQTQDTSFTKPQGWAAAANAH
jgi:hypothetical protein